MKKNPAITDATRQAFVDAFCLFYRKRPIERITAKEVAEKAGYSRATFYKYFKDIYEIEEYIANELLQAVRDGISEGVEKDDLLDDFVYRFSEVLQGREEYVSLMFGANKSSFNRKMKNEALPFLMSVFEVAPDDRKARYALEFYLSGVLELLGTWVRSGRKIPVETLGELIKGILEEGILKQVVKE